MLPTYLILYYIFQLHQNPCFYIKKETEDTEILRKDETVNLSNGDRFGLLPGSYWYELLELPDSVEPTTTPALTTSGSPTDTACGHTVGEPHKESPTLTQSSTEAPADPNESAVLDFQLNDTLQADPAPGSPSLLGQYLNNSNLRTLDYPKSIRYQWPYSL